MRKTETYFTCDGCQTRRDEIKMLRIPADIPQGICLTEEGDVRIALVRRPMAKNSSGAYGLHLCLECQSKMLHRILDQVDAQLEKAREGALDKIKPYLQIARNQQ